MQALQTAVVGFASATHTSDVASDIDPVGHAQAVGSSGVDEDELAQALHFEEQETANAPSALGTQGDSTAAGTAAAAPAAAVDVGLPVPPSHAAQPPTGDAGAGAGASAGDIALFALDGAQRLFGAVSAVFASSGSSAAGKSTIGSAAVSSASVAPTSMPVTASPAAGASTTAATTPKTLAAALPTSGHSVSTSPAAQRDDDLNVAQLSQEPVCEGDGAAMSRAGPKGRSGGIVDVAQAQAAATGEWDTVASVDGIDDLSTATGNARGVTVEVRGEDPTAAEQTHVVAVDVCDELPTVTDEKSVVSAHGETSSAAAGADNDNDLSSDSEKAMPVAESGGQGESVAMANDGVGTSSETTAGAIAAMDDYPTAGAVPLSSSGFLAEPAATTVTSTETHEGNEAVSASGNGCHSLPVDAALSAPEDNSATGEADYDEATVEVAEMEETPVESQEGEQCLAPGDDAEANAMQSDVGEREGDGPREEAKDKREDGVQGHDVQ